MMCTNDSRHSHFEKGRETRKGTIPLRNTLMTLLRRMCRIMQHTMVVHTQFTTCCKRAVLVVLEISAKKQT